MKYLRVLFLIPFLLLYTCSKNSTSSNPEPSPKHEAFISSPVDSAIVYEIVEITVSFVDEEGDSVKYYIDNAVPAGAIDRNAPFVHKWDVTGYQDSTSHRLSAKAYIDGSIIYTDTVNVIVNNSIAKPPSSVLEIPNDITASSYTLVWTKSSVPDFKSYRLFYSEQSGVNLQSTLLKTIEENEKTSLIIDSQLDNTSMYYKVYVFDTLNLYSGSNEIEVRTLNLPPDTAEFLTLTELGDIEIYLLWTPSKAHDFEKYAIHRSLSSNVSRQDYLVTELTGINDTTYIDRTVEGLKQYHYKVFTVDSGDSASASNELSVTVSDPRPSFSNIISYSSETERSIDITWQACWDMDFDHYKLFRSLIPEVLDTSELVAEVSIPGDTTYTDEELFPAEDYYYRLYVYDNNGFYRASNILHCQTIDENPEPVSVMSAGDPDENILRIAWTKNDNVDFRCYKIYRSTFPGLGVAGDLVDSIMDVNINSFTDSNLIANQDYYYTVATFDMGNNFSTSNEYYLKTLPPEPIPVTLSRQIECTDDAICLVWSKNTNTDFSHYRICRSESPNVTVSSQTLAIKHERNDTIYYDSDISENIDYYYRVFTYDIDENYSASNNIKASAGNNALYFDGEADWATIPYNSDFDLSNGFTIEMWFNPYSINSGNSDNKLLTKEYSNDCAYCIDFKPDYIRGYIDRGHNQTRYEFDIPVEEWIHVAYTFNSGTGRIYINGELKSHSSGSSIIPTSDSSVHIGCRPKLASISSFHGIIDELRIWNYARSEIQLKNNMGIQISGNESGLILYFNFNETSGQVLNDSSQNANNGYLGNSIQSDENDPSRINSDAPITLKK